MRASKLLERAIEMEKTTWILYYYFLHQRLNRYGYSTLIKLNPADLKAYLVLRNTVWLALVCAVKDSGQQLKVNGFDPGVQFGMRDSVIQNVCAEPALNTPAGPARPLPNHGKAESLPNSTPVGRGKFCFCGLIDYNRAARHCLGEQ